MLLSIITPTLNQLDWLRMCIASVADQIAPEVQGAESRDALKTQSPSSLLPAPAQSPLAIEHIIQDGGTPGIEDFAREVGAELKSRYGGDFVSDLQAFELLHFRTASGYTLRVFKEPDAGMYDAINKGIAKISGDLWAWINSDEQYLPGTLAYVAEWFAVHPGVEILCGDALLTDAEGGAVSYRRIVKPQWVHTRLVHLASASCSSFYKRSIVARGGLFDTRWRSIGDAEWMARMLKAGVLVKTCGKALASFAFTGVNTSESPLAAQESARWESMPDAPPTWLKLPVTLLYRIRKMLAGAYRRRSLTYSLYEKGSRGRVTRTAMGLGWGWGGRGRKKLKAET